jgi:hypothetical protein
VTFSTAPKILISLGALPCTDYDAAATSLPFLDFSTTRSESLGVASIGDAAARDPSDGACAYGAASFRKRETGVTYRLSPEATYQKPRTAMALPREI